MLALVSVANFFYYLSNISNCIHHLFPLIKMHIHTSYSLIRERIGSVLIAQYNRKITIHRFKYLTKVKFQLLFFAFLQTLLDDFSQHLTSICPKLYRLLFRIQVLINFLTLLCIVLKAQPSHFCVFQGVSLSCLLKRSVFPTVCITFVIKNLK